MGHLAESSFEAAVGVFLSAPLLMIAGAVLDATRMDRQQRFGAAGFWLFCPVILGSAIWLLDKLAALLSARLGLEPAEPPGGHDWPMILPLIPIACWLISLVVRIMALAAPDPDRH